MEVKDIRGKIEFGRQCETVTVIFVKLKDFILLKCHLLAQVLSARNILLPSWSLDRGVNLGF